MKSKAQTPISNRGFDAQILSTVPYNKCLNLGGAIASIDNVRIKHVYHKSSYNFDTHQRYDTLEHLLNILTDTSMWLSGEYDVKTSESGFRIGNYSHTLTFMLPDGESFAVLAGRYSYDSLVKQVEPEIVLDFNPNKIPEKAWRWIADLLAPMAQEISVQRFDLAIDFPICRNHLQLMQRPGSKHKKWTSEDGAITEYVGERSHHAAIKLYDKGADLGVDIVCSRLEITIVPDKFKSVKDLFPEILTLAPLELTMSFDSLPFEVQAVILHPDLYDRCKASVSRNTWAKYKKILANYEASTGNGSGIHVTLPDDQIEMTDAYIKEYLKSFTSGRRYFL